MRRIMCTLILALGLSLGCRMGEHNGGGAVVTGGDRTAGADEVANVVEAGCGMCIFGMADTSCELAVEIGGKVYRVEGSKLDDHGDAHAADGMCMVARQAYVEGRIEGDKFIARKVELQK